MNKKIIALIDYKNRFGSKHYDQPYRSGMDKTLLTSLFKENGYEIQFEYFHQVDLRNVEKYKDTIVLYTSSEDIGYHYKSYIEDVVFGLEAIGALLIPDYRHLRANNNKVFMEFFKTIVLQEHLFYSKHFGSLKDLKLDIDTLKFPAVLKTAEGASGTGVFLVNNKKQLIKRVKKLKNYNHLKEDIKDFLRCYLHKGYQTESKYRNKFIIQPFLPNLKNDWKVLVYGEKYFVLNRGVRKNDFRASGSKTNYKTDLDAEMPTGLLDYVKHIQEKFSVPQISLDIIYYEDAFYLIEFQTVYFGTSTINMSKNYFYNENNEWKTHKIDQSLEQIYTESIIHFLTNNENSLRS